MPAISFLEKLQDGPVSKALRRKGGLEKSQDDTLINFRDLVERRALEFPESTDTSDGMLSIIEDLASFEIDLISGAEQDKYRMIMLRPVLSCNVDAHHR